jgi:hypothetical protein
MNAELRTLAMRLHWVKNLNRNPDVTSWDWGMQNPINLISLSDSVQLAVLNMDGVILKSWPAASKLYFEKLTLQNDLPADSLVNAGTDSAAVRLALRLPNEMQPAAWLVGEKLISEKMGRRFKNIVIAAQMRQYLDLRESELRQSLLLAFLVLLRRLLPSYPPAFNN